MTWAALVPFFIVLVALLWLALFGVTRVGLQRRVNPLVIGSIATGVSLVAVGSSNYAVMDRLGFVGPRTPEPPSTITDPADPAHRDSVMTYAGRLVFNDTTIHGATDKQFLDTLGVDPGTGNTVPMPGGPLATIAPEENTHRNKRSDLEGIGRIMLKIVIEDARGYPPLGLPAGTSYVWVGSLLPGEDSASATGYVVPANRSIPVRQMPRPIVYKRNRKPNGEEYGWNNAIARWTFTPYDAATWWPCVKHGCCQGI